MAFCLEEANKAEFLCGLFGVIAYLCDKLFMCPELVTESFALGDFICDSSNVVRYTAETVNGEHSPARSMMLNEPVWEQIYEAVNVQNITTAMKNAPAESRHLKECEPKSELKMKRTHFICGLLGSFGFICDGLDCVDVATESFKAGDFVCDLSSVAKFIALSALNKDKPGHNLGPMLSIGATTHYLPSGIRRKSETNYLFPDLYSMSKF